MGNLLSEAKPLLLRLLAAASLFVAGVALYALLVILAGEQGMMLMGVLLFPYAALIGAAMIYIVTRPTP